MLPRDSLECPKTKWLTRGLHPKQPSGVPLHQEGGAECSVEARVVRCEERRGRRNCGAVAKKETALTLRPMFGTGELQQHRRQTRARLTVAKAVSPNDTAPCLTARRPRRPRRAPNRRDDEEAQEVPRPQPEARAAVVLLLRTRLRRPEDSHFTSKSKALQMRPLRKAAEHSRRYFHRHAAQ